MVGSHFILCARSFITVVMHTRIFLLLVSGFLSFVAAEQGYEMLAQAFEAAYIDLRYEGSTAFSFLGTEEYAQDCQVNVALYPYPEFNTTFVYANGSAVDEDSRYFVSENALWRILSSRRVRVCTWPGFNASDFIAAIFNRIGQYYLNEQLSTVTVSASTIEDCFTLLDNNEVEVTDAVYGVAELINDKRVSVYWRPSCSVLAGRPYLISLPISGVSDMGEFSDYILHQLELNVPVQACTETTLRIQILKNLFPGITIVSANNTATCRQMVYISSITTMALATLESGDCPTGLACFDPHVVTPAAAFFKRESPEAKKVSSSNLSSAEWWETGNEQFAELYEAAMMNLAQMGYIDNAFTFWQEVYYAYEDCVPTGGFKILSLGEYTGTAKRVLENKLVRIGSTTMVAMPMVNMTSVPPTGLLPGVERQIFSWIADQFSLGEITREYHLYSSTKALFHGLANGEFDVTALFYATGSFFSDDNGNMTRRRVAFRPSCALLGDVSEFVVRYSDGINSVSDLRDYMETHPGQLVGTDNAALSGAFAWPLRHLSYGVFYLPDDTYGLLSSLMSDPNVITVVPNEPFETGNFTDDVVRFVTGVITPTAAFFRRDKVFPCGNSELDIPVGEECETVDSLCTPNCTCSTGYKLSSDFMGCTEINHDDGMDPVYIVVIVLCVVSVASILVAAVTLAIMPYLKRRSFHEGAARQRGAVFFARRYQTHSAMLQPLQTD